MDKIINDYIFSLSESEFIKGNDFRIAYWILERSKREGFTNKIYVSLMDISKNVNMSKPTVSRSLGILEQESVIEYSQGGNGYKSEIRITFIDEVYKYAKGEISLKRLTRSIPKTITDTSEFIQLIDKNCDVEKFNIDPNRKDSLPFDSETVKILYPLANLTVSKFYPSEAENYRPFQNFTLWKQLRKISLRFMSSAKPMNIKEIREQYDQYYDKIMSIYRKVPPIYSIYYINLLYVLDHYLFKNQLVPLIVELASKGKSISSPGAKENLKITGNEDWLSEKLSGETFIETYNKWLVHRRKKGKAHTEESMREELRAVSEYEDPLGSLRFCFRRGYMNIFEPEKDFFVKNYKKDSEDNGNGLNVIADV